MKLDVVYPVKEGKNNNDLRYSLRSLEKYGRNIGRVFIVGFAPSWVQNVEVIPTEQTADKWLNTRRNIEAACKCKKITADFVLFNDDFILTDNVTDWYRFNQYHRGTLFEKEVEYIPYTDHNVWREGFHFNRQLLILAKCRFDEPLNYELHCPIVLNKEKRLHLFDRAEFRKYKDKSDPLLFQRSIYLNLFPAEQQIQINETKLFGDVDNPEKLTKNGFFSVSDNLINNSDYPKLNAFLSSFEKSCFERD